jgi:lysine-specific demethylase/histidyl-hydroxylase NO66
VVDAGLVHHHFCEGATILLSNVHSYWPPITRFCRQLELALTMPVQANVYVTPRNSRGFDLHYDSHDVLVLQIFGSKHWEVYDATVESALIDHTWEHVQVPDGAILSAHLERGDTLYLPRGFPHVARTTDTASAHLTIGILAYTWVDVFQGIAEQSRVMATFRDSLPIGFCNDSQQIKELCASRLRDFAGWIAHLDPDVLSDTMARMFWSTRPPIVTEHLCQLVSLDKVTDETVVRQRPQAICKLFHGEQELTVLLGDRKLTMPNWLNTPMLWILETSTFVVSDLAGHLDQASRLVLVRRLIREGLLEAIPVSDK